MRLAVLALTLLALILFSREKIALETSSLFLLVSLSVGFELFPFSQNGTRLHAVDFFSGFGHEALVAVSALMVAGQGVMRTNALDPAGRILARLWKKSPSLSLLLTLMFGATISAFINNVPVVVLLMPVLISVSLKTGTSAPSRAHAHGLFYPAGWHGYHHWHLNQSAYSLGRCRHGPTTPEDV